jgi:alpha-ketoglutarate-dependent dioxygenase FTO
MAESSDAPSPPPAFRVDGAPAFIGPGHPAHTDCLACSFGNFVREPARSLPSEFHQHFRGCLRGIQADGLLDRYDLTQPMGPGTPIARTRVTRCLIGKRGITYKYLGLRMFAHPWRGRLASAACAQMRRMSRRLAQRADRCGGAGSARFNLVLLNRMAPEAAPKQEKVYGMGGVSVSWHADSSLQASRIWAPRPPQRLRIASS